MCRESSGLITYWSGAMVARVGLMVMTYKACRNRSEARAASVRDPGWSLITVYQTELNIRYAWVRADRPLLEFANTLPVQSMQIKPTMNGYIYSHAGTYTYISTLSVMSSYRTHTFSQSFPPIGGCLVINCQNQETNQVVTTIANAVHDNSKYFHAHDGVTTYLPRGLKRLWKNLLMSLIPFLSEPCKHALLLLK